LRETQQYLSALGEACSVRVDQGDLVMSICGTLGRPIMIDMPACIHDGFVQFCNLRGIETEFLFYALQHSEPAFCAMGQPGTQTNLNTTLVGRHRIFCPNEREQRRIAEILSTVDEAIEHTEALIAKTQQIKAGLMHDLFTRGVTKEGQLRPPREEAPQLYKDTPLGWIPREWEVSTLGEKGEVLNGTTPSRARPDYWDGAVPWLSSSKANDYQVQEPTEHITARALAECSVRLLPVGTVIVGMIGQGKTRGMSARLEIEATINQNLGAVVPGPDLEGGFCHLYLHHHYQRLRGQGRGSNQDALNCSLLAAFPIIAPPLSEQREIAVRLKGADARMDAEQQEVAKLRLLKNGLLNDLLTGRVRVPVAESSEVAAHV
jgi:type I restriction enzyme S subunit